ncbi:hypothetical protein [Woeseia oceani]|uniref:Uncharacterized protein n=1 Tax=Woeseia oceani TaxID=1548547 RepID=A0A193LJI8_9GAMM|nr:hypothetical protein [Woeseia oceani]ANO52598.1 hypothetical protein BA177_16675 [Woeseia oceani]
MRRVIPALAVLLLYATPADACRCAQRNLAEYFNDANTVAVGALVETEVRDGLRYLHFDLAGPSYKGTPLRAAGSRLTVTTNTDSASCGIHPEISAIYVLFAYPSDDKQGSQLHVDSCNGTRVHLPAHGEEPIGYQDVPARFVARQLNGLAGMNVLREVSANAPRPHSADNERLIGLLDLAPLAHGGHVDVYPAPDATLQPLARIADYAALESREYSYEQPGTVVYAAIPDWYRLKLADGCFVWVKAAETGTFFSYPELAINRLNYLTDAWAGFVWPEPGAGLPYRDPRVAVNDAAEYPVEVHEMVLVGGMPFLRVTVLKGDVCSGNEPGVRATGWIPAFGVDGEATTWFWSRGC